MADRYARIVQAVYNQPWAILQPVFEAMLEVVSLRVAGGRFTEAEIAARTGDKPSEPLAVTRVGPVGVLPLHGVMAQRMNLFMQISGGTSTELFGQAFDAAMADPETQAIVLSIDSPGGSVFGTEELAQKIFKARGSKPIVAVADSMAASAAYLVGSQADQFVATPSGMVGSIGVVTAHTDISKAEEQMGVKTTLVAMPPAKVMGHPYEPLSDEARAEIEARIAPYYDLFVKAVARGRGISAADVREGYGQGRMLAAAPALKAGMVDRIESLSDVVARLQTPQGRRAVLTAHSPSAAETTAQEPSPATAQESDGLSREVLKAELAKL